MASRSLAAFNTLDNSIFDIIIIGGGTAGCLLASRLATNTPLHILLIEAGRDTDEAEPDVAIPGKYISQLSSAEGNWKYETVPQKALKGRRLVYHRGRGLGGSTLNNFMGWVRGPKADYDDWARMAGDERWGWEKVLSVFQDLESFEPAVPTGMEQYAKATEGAHGKQGPITVQYGSSWIPGIETFVAACEEAGIKRNLDMNDGQPVGVSVAQFCIAKGERVSSARAFLSDALRQRSERLKIVTSTSCARILFKDKKAVGVELFRYDTDKKVRVNCTQEVIATAGTFGSPQLLLLSGVGPGSELEKHSIPVIAAVPGVGKNLQDHSALSCEYLTDPSILSHNQILSNPEALSKAEEQWRKDRTGPLATFGASASIAFTRLERLFKSKEFQDLDFATQSFFLEKTRPSTEIWMLSGPLYYGGTLTPNDSCLAHEGLMQNNLSRGSVTLASADPKDKPLIDPNYLAHPLDLRIAVETVREIVRVGQTKAYEGVIEKMIHGPGGNSDVKQIDLEDDAVFEDFVRSTMGQGFHAMSTCRMGPDEDVMSVVDTDFRVRGVDGLRVADLSVCPILTTNHTQVNVYLIAEMCARRMIEEYSEAGYSGVDNATSPTLDKL